MEKDTIYTYVNKYDNSEQFHNRDWNIRKKIRESIANDERIPLLDRQNIQVAVLNSMVMLTGAVRQVSSKMLAYGDALQVEGIIDVIDTIACPNQVASQMRAA